MLEHHRVVCDIFARVDACLPMRFPTVVDDVSTLQVEAFADQLEHVRHACELAITAAWRDSSPPETGRAYLSRRVRAQRIADEIQATLGEDLIEASAKLCPSPKVAISLAVLVRRDAAETVKSRIPRNAEDVRILVHGPWPPYTFADRPRLGTRNASA
jgi:gas vesicle protein GvpL/GvpF